MSDDQHQMQELAKRYPAKARKARTGSRSMAIQLFCLQCLGGSITEVKNCGARLTCELWPYRVGGFEEAGTPIPPVDKEKSAIAQERYKKHGPIAR